ncbi:MAG TPA: hypothetical protein VFE20_09090 [Thermoleophilia bacterium]|nr:hypothetical protein [Thermoleophilia bacterium]
MITPDIPRDLARVADGLDRVGAEHRKCLSCHCYREVGEDLLSSYGSLEGHVKLVEGPLPEDLRDAVDRIRLLLDSSEGAHG